LASRYSWSSRFAVASGSSLQRVGEQVREVHRVARPGAEVDDAVDGERAAIVRQLPAFQ
jgi:hypothetical protein